MSSQDRALTMVYPSFDAAPHDLWFARLGGSGLGNCFYPYFHAYVLALRSGARLIAPPWFSLKLGPLLRGESSKRFYWRLFRACPGDLGGVAKLYRMLRGYPGRVLLEIDGADEPALVSGALNVVVSRKWTFNGLHPYRDAIRARLLAILAETISPAPRWGQGDFIGIHVRLGDFKSIEDPQQMLLAKNNARIPVFWYVNVARALRRRYPDRPIILFSDGKSQELQPLLDLGALLYRSGSDIADLIRMSEASLLVGSNSTFSRWAAFLGNMPSIWLAGAAIDKEVTGDALTDPGVPLLHVPLDAAEVALWP
jgi:hypothetical protein